MKKIIGRKVVGLRMERGDSNMTLDVAWAVIELTEQDDDGSIHTRIIYGEPVYPQRNPVMSVAFSSAMPGYSALLRESCPGYSAPPTTTKHVQK